jgi:FMN phosphatase YigB (HAD superfamily)
VTVEAVVFDVGETLVDETRVWAEIADELGVPLYDDARPCLAVLRRGGFRLGLAGNAGRAAYERIEVDVDFVASSADWGVQKPEQAFFARVVEECGCTPERIAYVGDRVDNDVLPSRAAGLRPVHVRRGPWGYLHDPPAGTAQIGSLAELPEVLAHV